MIAPRCRLCYEEPCVCSAVGTGQTGNADEPVSVASPFVAIGAAPGSHSWPYDWKWEDGFNQLLDDVLERVIDAQDPYSVKGYLPREMRGTLRIPSPQTKTNSLAGEPKEGGRGRGRGDLSGPLSRDGKGGDVGTLRISPFGVFVYVSYFAFTNYLAWGVRWTVWAGLNVLTLIVSRYVATR